MIRGLPAIGLATLLFAGCAVYDSSLTVRPSTGKGGNNHGDGGGTGDTPGAGGTPGGGGGSGAGGSSGVGGQTCNRVTYPARPSVKNAGGDHEIVAVQYDIDLGDSPPNTAEEPTRFRNIGFDLDGLCTTPDMATSLTTCTLPPKSAGVIDGPNGQDNAVGKIVQTTRNTITQFSSEIYTEQLQKGAANAILHVTGYNGQADDDQVHVEALVSAQFDAFKKGSTPNWDGNDVWPIASDSVVGNNITKARNSDPNGYVTNHKLVATYTSAGLRLVIGLSAVSQVNLSLVLHAAYVVCDIEETDAGKWGYTLQNCTLVGRWVADDLIKQLAHFPDPLDLNNPKPLCMSSTSYPIFKEVICGLRDVLSDFSGPTTPCDALSFGVKYNTRPGILGDVFVPEVEPRMCPPGKDPSLDSCDSNEDGGTPSGTGGGGGRGGAGGAGGSGGKGGASGATDAGSDASSTDASL